jgi:hypothetical protein
MKKINNSVLALALFVGIANANAQEKKTLTLDDAVQLGIQNSKNLKIDAAKIEEATANLWKPKTDSFRAENFRKLYVSSFKTKY